MVHFASDNNAGAHPEVLAALAAVNGGHAPGYGDDEVTVRAEAEFRRLFGEQAQVFFAFGGTGANVVGLAAALRPYQAIVCPARAHLDVDECGAYERFAGGKLIAIETADGKLRPDDVEAHLHGVGDQHHVQPGAISISQSSEVGTVYSLEEMRALGAVAKRHGLLFHVDGARIANAVASLGAGPRELITEAGVDLLTFGGTKNGMLCGEAIVVPREHAVLASIRYTRKSGMQLPSKMRFVAAQFEALLRDGLWLRSATHANRMAQRLAGRVREIRGVTIAYPVQANGVFAQIPAEAIAPLQRYRRFYPWDPSRSIVRWMTAFDTTEADVDAFAEAIAREIGGAVPA